MRKNGCAKNTGYVIVPLYVALAEGENYEEAIKRARFDTVLEVLQTLKEIDESFADYLKALAQPKKRAKGSSDWKLSHHVAPIAPTVLLEQLVHTISLEVIDSLIPSWDKMFAEFVAFKEAHGHGNVPYECPLGKWCDKQRQRKDSLSPERFARLEAEGFCWNLKAAAWDKMFVLLVAYREVHGHCNVPYDDGPLGKWVRTQRARCSIPERRARLTAIGFCWDPFAALWNQKIEELTAYGKVHGHCNVPAQSGPLGEWCSAVRTKRRRNELSPEQIAQLDAIGFCWGPHTDIWDKRVAELTAYQKIHGHCNVPHSYGPLGVWVSTVHRRWRKGKLSPEQIAQLDALGFCWDYDVALWDKRVAELIAYQKFMAIATCLR
jgi:hypothetical protein